MGIGSIFARDPSDQGLKVELNYLVAQRWKGLRLASYMPLGTIFLSSESKWYGIIRYSNILQVNAHNIIFMSLVLG